MKKLLAILCAVAILTTSLINSGVISQIVKAEEEKRFLQSFATAEDYEASKQYINNAGTNITLSYDETEGAIKAVPTTPGKGNHQVRIDPKWGSQTVKVDEYPVIAIKIKFNNVQNPAFGGVFTGTNKAKRPSGSTASVFSDSFLSGSAKTGDWQLLVVDASNKVWKQGDSTTSATFCGTYEAFICSLTANNQTTTANDIYWIQWAGAFKTVEEAYAYDSEVVTPSPFFYDFEDETTTNNLINSGIVGHNGSNMGRSYNAEEKALKLTPSTSNKNQFIFLAENNNAKVADYPVMAMKVKFEDPNINFAGIWAGTNRASGSKYGGDALLGGTIETGGWQIIVFDGSQNIFPNTKTKDAYECNELANRIVHYMQEHISEKITLQQLAQINHISISTLKRTFVKQTGCSVMSYLTALRIEEAKQMLAEHNYSLNEIAEKTGFGSVHYFSSVFKKHTGKTPKEFQM